MGEISCRGAVAVWELPAASPPQLSPVRSKPTQYFPVPAVPGAISVVLQIGPHRVGPLPLCIGAQCPFITLIKCLKGLGVLQTVFVFVFWLMVTGQVMSPRHSDQMSLVPGSYLWVPGGYMSVKEGYKYAVVFPHVSLRGKMYFLRSERSKLTNCIMIKVCELVECRL